MKKYIIALIIIIILVAAALYWKSPSVSEPISNQSDTTLSINKDLNAIDTGNVDSSFTSVNADIKTL
jgi:hypothetical protein